MGQILCIAMIATAIVLMLYLNRSAAAQTAQ
jgi:prolipoprotein diacylglyceryltransferase